MVEAKEVPYVSLPSGVCMSVRGHPVHVACTDDAYPDLLALLRKNVTDEYLLQVYDLENKTFKVSEINTATENELEVYQLMGLVDANDAIDDGDLLDTYDSLLMAKHASIEYINEYAKIVVIGNKQKILFTLT